MKIILFMIMLCAMAEIFGVGKINPSEPGISAISVSSTPNAQRITDHI